MKRAYCDAIAVRLFYILYKHKGRCYDNKKDREGLANEKGIKLFSYFLVVDSVVEYI